jgi:hypothetical protein
MDTLVVAADDKMPMCFQRKFLSLPNADMIIAGTGLANLINGWFSYVSLLQQVGDIDRLNELAPQVVRSSVEAVGGLGSITTTLYHFGYSKVEARYIGFAYRSTSEFRSERLPYALGLKPYVPVAPTDNIEFPGFLIGIILEQQRQDRLLPVDEQVGIGGEIEFAVLSGGVTRIETVHRFATYESERQHIESRNRA